MIGHGDDYADCCQGNCGGVHLTPFLTTVHIMEEYHKLNHLKRIQPCCVPIRFCSISLIHFGPDSNIIKRALPKSVVDECECP
jgi:inhibin beta